ncbi:hypothetical protein IWQ56_002635 [Coemansia nantahalensis]|uniref:Uncharacterized protein n=1 Tax=Coemansia helicoidea TaxID=1286919 RepID=A0ACC1L775_9FUNG|nr:hypothetical protein IWQ56_002635 [Coemansia nantahalensis]KAJ2802204.1 hypothetical protein H4R21_002505 [Coemansia helicoidea]
MSAAPAPTKRAGVFRDVIDSIFEPGVNRGVLVVMNGAFAGLFAILGYLLFATRLNIHVCALTVIAALLFAAIQWFIREVAAVQKPPAAAGAAAAQPPRQKKKKL